MFLIYHKCTYSHAAYPLMTFFLAKQTVHKNIKVKGQAEIALSNPMGRAKKRKDESVVKLINFLLNFYLF